ncbi:substrate-binding periplasmic protein [Dongshaea marina]|uniref:substrate-binding periplasmic protein n=1 Tax=Dongshaea marina TaxID=2047966 RepID=UPI000D3EBD29|nr:transporter substrate-binding domain-containing protein [Dongshaea marina]
MRATLAALLILIFSVPLAATQQIRVVSEQWEDFVETGGYGYYMDTLRRIYPEEQYQLTLRIMPYLRAIDMVAQQQADIVLGLSDGDEPPEVLLSHYPVEEERFDLVLSPKFAPHWQGLESLKGKRVMAKVGYDMDTYLDFKADYRESNDIPKMIALLKRNRVDAVFGYVSDFNRLPEFELGPKLEVKEDVLKEKTFFGFSSTPKGTELRELFDQRLKQLILSGDLKSIMEDNIEDSFEYPSYEEYPELNPSEPKNHSSD